MRDLRSFGAASLWGAALVFSLLLGGAGVAQAQFARLVPPPPCVIPGELQVRRAAIARNAKPLVVIEPLDVTNAERRNLYLPFALSARLRDRLGALPTIRVVSEGTFERALYEAGGSADSAATLLGADWIVRGKIRSGAGVSDLVVELRKRGAKTVAWTASYRLPPRTLASVEQLVLEALVARIPRTKTTLPAVAAGGPRLGSGDAALALSRFLLRDPSLAAADSARRALERAFAADTASTELALALAEAYNAVASRGGAAPPMSVAAALRRVDNLTSFVQAREPRRAELWTARAVAARLRDTLAFAGALEAHAKALALAPRNVAAMMELANTYIMLGHDDKAASELRRLLAVEPDYGAALTALAGTYLRARRYREACAYSNAAVAATPFDPRAYSVRTRARLNLGQARDAYADAETAARLSNDIWTKGLRFLTEIEAGNSDGATQISRILAANFLKASSVLSVEDAAMLATAWMRQGDQKRAMLALTRARPRGRLLATTLRDPVFEPLRRDSTFRSLLTPRIPKGKEY